MSVFPDRHLDQRIGRTTKNQNAMIAATPKSVTGTQYHLVRLLGVRAQNQIRNPIAARDRTAAMIIGNIWKSLLWLLNFDDGGDSRLRTLDLPVMSRWLWPTELNHLRKDAGLSRLSSVRPLCHTDLAPPRPASRLKGVYYEKLSARLTGATPVRGTHGKVPLVHP